MQWCSDASLALHGTGDAEAKDAAMLLRKTGLKSKGLDATAADKSLEEERQTFNREGEKEHGFTSSVVPTLEEKTIAETILKDSHPTIGDAKGKENGSADHSQAQMDSELFGTPANANTQRDDQVPGTRQDHDATEMEEKAVEARSIIRKHLSSRLDSKQYTIPTPTPHVDPNGFEDPICDAFWKKTWQACAVHNVGLFPCCSQYKTNACIRLRYTARCSMPFRMTW